MKNKKIIYFTYVDNCYCLLLSEKNIKQHKNI